ncbi:MAG: hypothetical protein MUC50_15595 [Myxococcota bacterium]|nr:hypothetical protein [Myxococcota bacterium]
MPNPSHATPDKPELLDRRSVRIGLFVVVPLALCALIASAIHVSMMGIDHTILVFGQRQLLAGSPSALRLTLMTDAGDMLPASRVSGSLACRGGETPLPLRSDAPDDLFAPYAFTTPKAVSGTCQVRLDIAFGKKRQRISFPVQISTPPLRESLEIPSDVPVDAKPSAVVLGPHRIEAFTEDRGAPTGFSSVLFLRALTDPFTSSPMELGLRHSEDEDWSEVRTDALGLAALPLRPYDMSARLTVRGARRPSHVQPRASGEPHGDSDTSALPKVSDARLEPLVVYSGISVAVHNPLLGVHEPLRLTVRQLSAFGPVVVDAFHSGVYVAGFNGQFQSGSAELALRLPGPGLYRLQVAASSFATPKSIAVRHVYAMPESESQNEALYHLLDLLSSSDIDKQWAQSAGQVPLERGVGFDRQRLAAFALARLYRGARPLDRLLSSRQADDAELAQFKSLFQRGVMMAILLLGLGVAALTSLLAAAALARQRRITAMILSESEGEPDAHPRFRADPGQAEHNWRTTASAAVLFIIVMGAFASLAVLVFVLRWFG